MRGIQESRSAAEPRRDAWRDRWDAVASRAGL